MKKYLIIATLALFATVSTDSFALAQNYTFNNDLSVGTTGQDVVNLQTWLIGNGFNIPAVSSGRALKGYFGSETKAAVTAYQQSVGLPAFGYFGPLTRGRFNSGPHIDVNFQVTSPNGGEVWQKGTVHNITWTGAPGILNQTGDIKLEFQVPACTEPTANPRCMIAVRAPVTIATKVSLDQGSYAWTVGSFLFDTNAVPGYISDPVPLSAGQYKIQICTTNGSQCDDSDNYFSITSNGTVTGNAPVVNGVDSPTTLAVGQTGTWTIRATDPLNGTLSYSVLWGDEPGYAVTGSTMAVPAVMQTNTFAHSYSNAGNYMVTFTVRNSAGQQVQESSSVQVTGSNTAGPLRIISPNGGEIWQTGTTHNITWTSPAYLIATNADLQLMPNNSCSGQFCTQMYRMPYTIAANIPINQNSYSWNVGNVLPSVPTNSSYSVAPDGQYTIQICQTGTSVCALSNSQFTITSSQTSNVPDINVISPNGGEVWDQGLFHNVQVNVTGDAAKIGNLINVYLVDSSNHQTFLTSLTNTSPGINNISVQPGPAAYAGTYRIFVTLYSNSQIQAYDYSDGYITVTTAPPCPFGYTCAAITN